MKFLGREIIFRKASLPDAQQKAVPASGVNQSSWWYRLFEPFSGAWQRNVEWNVSTVLSYPIVYSCITLIADDIGKLPAYPIRKDTNGIWVTTDTRWIKDLLAKPNHYQNHIQFKQWWITSKLVAGNTYCLKQRDRSGRVIGLYILNPQLVQVLVAPNGEVFYQLNTDYLNEIGDVQVTVPASEMMHDRMNCLFHPLIGISPLFAAGLAAQQGLNIQNDAAIFFANGARPSGILTAPAEISDVTAKELKAHWEANFSGNNSGKIAVLGDGLKYESMRMDFVDAAVIEQLNWSDKAICGCFKVPGYKVGVGTIPATTNVEALGQEYYTQCLQIHIESMELVIDQGLELKEDEGIQLDLESLLRMDTATLIKTLGEGVKSMLYTSNEARKRLNLPPVQGGDTVLSQQQYYSLAALAKRDQSDDPFSTGTTSGSTESAEPADLEVPAEPIQNTALNGAQVTALQGIIAAVASGQLPIETARFMIIAAFPLISASDVNAMLSPLEEFTPTPPADDTAPADDEPADSEEDEEKSMALLGKLLPLFIKEELARENS